MLLNEEVYKDKVTACWIGKNIGGTVGAPMEFNRQINELDGYTQSFDNPLPNDDLDIQLLWLIALEEKGIHLSAELLCEYWQRYITPHWGEYGIAKVNMKSSVLSPMSGTTNNYMFKNSNGAFIRSEIWACLAPGRPDIAVAFAVNDAIIDHGNGEGTWGEVFCAAIESAAFVTNDFYKLIDIGLSYIPSECGLAKAIHDAIYCYKEGMTKKEARNYMLTNHRGSAAFVKSISDEDRAAGFLDGLVGYDCPLNVAIIILGMLYGEGNFDKTVLSTIYFGEDTDCTVGTACSLYGIMYGSANMEKKWTEPIGKRIVTGCLNLGELGTYGDVLPQTVDELTTRVYKQHLKVANEYSIYCANKKGFETDSINTDSLFGNDKIIKNCITSMDNIIFRFNFYNVYVNYGQDCYINENESRRVTIKIESAYKTADILNMRWFVPDDVTVTPAKEGKIFLMLGGFVNCSKTIDFEFVATSLNHINRYVLELTIDGRTTAMYVPIVFHNGNYNK